MIESANDLSRVRPRGPVTRLLDLFSSIWLGVGLMSAIFIYSSVGSALPPNAYVFSPREFFEKTEMEWFTWWPFNLLIALFAINLIVATLRRIPLRATTAGVWMIHTGILVLCAGSVYYFSEKIEAGTPVFRRRLDIEVPGGHKTHLVCLPGNQVHVEGSDGPYHVRIARIEPEWQTPPGSAREHAYRVTAEISGPQGSLTRALVAGHPELTTEQAARSRTIEITHPEGKAGVTLEVRDGASARLETPAGQFDFQVAGITPDWPILSGDDKGQRVFSVQVQARGPSGEFVRQLLEGYPQYTEDVLPGQGRAVKVTGRKLVDEALNMALESESTGDTGTMAASVKTVLDYEPQEHAYLAESAALYVRPAGTSDWTQRPIKGLPHFSDYVRSPEDVWNAADVPHLPGLDLPVPAVQTGDPLDGLDVRVTGYLRFAFEQPVWTDGGEDLFPVARLRFQAGPGERRDIELTAFDPQHAQSDDGRVAFVWVDSAKDIDALESQPPELVIGVPGSNVQLEVPVQVPEGSSQDQPFIDIAGTEFAYRVRGRLDNWRSTQGQMMSIVVLDLRTPEGVVTRYVADDPNVTKDSGGALSGAESGHDFRPPDPRIVTTYRPGSTRMVTVVSGPPAVGLHVLIDTPKTGRQRFRPEIGEPMPLAEGIRLTITDLFTHARLQNKPVLVPRSQRQREAEIFMVQVQFRQGAWTQRVWLPFSRFALPSEQYAGRQNPFQPRAVRLSDGREMELLYARERVDLPAAVALEDFTLLTHAGGLIGMNSNVRDYVSQLRFREPSGAWSEPIQMRLNDPAVWKGYSFFQATWDAPAADDPGMNFTGCGIGTRGGVHVQLAGTAIAVLGMIYTFYVKPIIIRRRRLNVHEQLEQEEAQGLRGRARTARSAASHVTAATTSATEEF